MVEHKEVFKTEVDQGPRTSLCTPKYYTQDIQVTYRNVHVFG